MFNLLSLVFRYLFILLIYLFMFGIIRLIYMDIKNINSVYAASGTYLKLINRKDSLPFKVKEVYNLEDSVTMGRGNDNDIVVKDPYISSSHIRITSDENEYFLEDLDSANGTYLNGDRVLDVVKLKNGDRIKLGQLDFLYVSND